MDQQFEFMRPLATGWLGKIQQAVTHKKSFNDIAEQCEQFFCGKPGFMWESKFQSKFLRGKIAPKFKMTMAKAFELVALFGPTLYWRNPERMCRPFKPVEIGPEVFGGIGDPFAQMIYEQSQQQQGMKLARDNARAQLMQTWLNYTPLEQPGGGLSRHAESAITEALVKGRGCLWVEPYQMPGSQRVMTGCFYDTVDNFLIDPDAESLEEAMWIAKRCVHPVWQVEREYNLPPGSLADKGSLESAESQGGMQSHDMQQMYRKQGISNDLIVYYKIWSKCGVGARLTGVTTALKDQFDKDVGDYAYIVVAPNVPYPLNATSKQMRTAYPEDVRQMFQWPVPYWRDDRWPVVCLDFYRKMRSPWPIAPMAPGLGELIFMNVIVSHLANRIWTTSRDIIAVLQSAAKDVKAILERGEDLVVLELNDAIHQEIQKVVQFLQHPPTNFDAWQILDRISENFDRRVGLTELLYGLNPGGTQPRTSNEVEIKQKNVSVRPEYMGTKVEEWMSEAARLEKFCTRWFVEPTDVAPLVGPTGAYLWQTLINDEDPEVVVREMEATVVAGSSRRPDKQRDVDNLNSVLHVLMPELSQHASVTGDTSAVNALIRQWGDALDMDVSGMLMGQRVPPPPPPEVLQAQQAQQEAEQQKLQAEAEAAQMEMETRLAESQIEQQARQAELEQQTQQMELEQLMKVLELRHDEDAHDQTMRQSEETHRMKLEQLQQQFKLKQQQARQTAKARPRPALAGARN